MAGRQAVLGLMMLVTTLVSACASPPAPTGVAAMIPDARKTVERFFGEAFLTAPKVVVAPDRAAFDAALPVAWDIGKTQCWMVGVGVADFLVVLDPAVWKTQACDHTGDPQEIHEILVHELTHSYHGQHNPTRDFTGAEDMAWFVEGLAVLVSRDGEDLRAKAGEALRSRRGPAALTDVWSGRDRYVMAGSLSRYIEATKGRAMLVRLLPMTRSADALAVLGLSEEELLAQWRTWLGAGAPV